MITLNWNCKVLLTLVAAAASTELVPERFLRPRDFNHHPFTDVGVPASLKPASILPSSHPYAILSKKRQREGRQFPHQDVFLYPTPHPSVLPRKHLETNEVNEVSNYEDPYVNIPKNYAFSYSVKDHQSGDDFSHSQAHNGKATRGQYRVKLPDGRVQVVSYTADHKGYRADVQYEEDPAAKRVLKPLFHAEQNIPETPAALPDHVPNTIREPAQFPQVKEEEQSPTPVSVPIPVRYRFVPRYNLEPSNYLATDPPQQQYISDPPQQQEYVSSTPAPVRFVISEPAGSTQAPQYDDSAYAQEKYISSTSPAPYITQQYLTSTPQFGDRHRYVSTTPTPYVAQAYTATAAASQGYEEYSSPSTQHVLVTPRTIFNSRNSEFKQRPHVLYRIVQPGR